MALTDVAQAGFDSSHVSVQAQQFELGGLILARQVFVAERCSSESKLNKVGPNEEGQTRFCDQLIRRSELTQRFVTRQTLVDFLVPIPDSGRWIS